MFTGDRSQDRLRISTDRVWRLERLPLRAATARAVLNALPEEPDDEWHDIPDSGKTRSILELDPAWALAIACSAGPIQPAEGRRGRVLVARQPAPAARSRK